MFPFLALKTEWSLAKYGKPKRNGVRVGHRIWHATTSYCCFDALVVGLQQLRVARMPGHKSGAQYLKIINDKPLNLLSMFCAFFCACCPL